MYVCMYVWCMMYACTPSGPSAPCHTCMYAVLKIFVRTLVIRKLTPLYLKNSFKYIDSKKKKSVFFLENKKLKIWKSFQLPAKIGAAPKAQLQLSKSIFCSRMYFLLHFFVCFHEIYVNSFSVPVCSWACGVVKYYIRSFKKKVELLVVIISFSL